MQISRRSSKAAEDKEMSFLDHLEALRWHIVRSVLAIVFMALIAFIFIEPVFNIIYMGPSHSDFWTNRQLCSLAKSVPIFKGLCAESVKIELQNLAVAGQLMLSITMSITMGLVAAFPYVAWELWRFFKPALSYRERRYTKGVVGAASLLFLAGTALGYFLITPITIQFLANYSLSPDIANRFDIENYIDVVTMTTLSISLVFELPVVVYFLARGGLLTPATMRQYRKHAIIVILILSAVLTPSSDIFSLAAVAIPFYLLYELSISVAYVVERRRKKEELVFDDENSTR